MTSSFFVRLAVCRGEPVLARKVAWPDWVLAIARDRIGLR